jgi:hypothetical protein
MLTLLHYVGKDVRERIAGHYSATLLHACLISGSWWQSHRLLGPCKCPSTDANLTDRPPPTTCSPLRTGIYVLLGISELQCAVIVKDANTDMIFQHQPPTALPGLCSNCVQGVAFPGPTDHMPQLRLLHSLKPRKTAAQLVSLRFHRLGMQVVHVMAVCHGCPPFPSTASSRSAR